MLTSVVRLPRDTAVRREYPDEISELRGGFNRHVNAPDPLLVHPRGRTWNRRQEWRLDSLQRLSCLSRRRPRPIARPLARKRLLGSGNDSGSKVLKALRGGLGPLPPGSDHRSDLLERLGREQRTHLGVARLVPLRAWDGPQLREQAGAVGVDSQGELARKRTGRTVHAVAV